MGDWNSTRACGDREHIGIGKTDNTALSTAMLRDPGGPGDSERCERFTNEVRKILGDRLDVLVANAGVSKSATLADHTIADFDNLFATNVRGPFFLVQPILESVVLLKPSEL